jgi:hypothetical protein
MTRQKQHTSRIRARAGESCTTARRHVAGDTALRPSGPAAPETTPRSRSSSNAGCTALTATSCSLASASIPGRRAPGGNPPARRWVFPREPLVTVVGAAGFEPATARV